MRQIDICVVFLENTSGRLDEELVLNLTTHMNTAGWNVFRVHFSIIKMYFLYFMDSVYTNAIQWSDVSS